MNTGLKKPRWEMCYNYMKHWKWIVEKEINTELFVCPKKLDLDKIPQGKLIMEKIKVLMEYNKTSEIEYEDLNETLQIGEDSLTETIQMLIKYEYLKGNEEKIMIF